MTNLALAAGAGFYFALFDSQDPGLLFVSGVLIIAAVVGVLSDRKE